MGHLINPISNRLSINTFWNSNWSLVNTFNYVNLFKKDYILFEFLDFFLKKSKYGKFNLLLSHYKIYRVFNNIFINFYYYNIVLEEKEYGMEILYLLNLLNYKENDINKKLINLENFYLSSELNSISTEIKSEICNKFNSFLNLDEINKKQKLSDLYKYTLKILFLNLFWYSLKYSINFYLEKLRINSENFFFNFFSLDFFSVTSNVLGTYISLKLKQNFSLDWVLRPIIKDLNIRLKNQVILGYKIVCSGRFTRKQIATYTWMKQGALGFNKFSNHIKYSESSIKLKYGLCGVKIWLNFGANNLKIANRTLLLLYPLYTPFKYVLNLKNLTISLSLNYWFYLYVRLNFFKKYTLNLYKLYLNIKLKIILKYFIIKIFKDYFIFKFSLNYQRDNILLIQLSTNNWNTYPKDKFNNIFKYE